MQGGFSQSRSRSRSKMSRSGSRKSRSFIRPKSPSQSPQLGPRVYSLTEAQAILDKQVNGVPALQNPYFSNLVASKIAGSRITQANQLFVSHRIRKINRYLARKNLDSATAKHVAQIVLGLK